MDDNDGRKVMTITHMAGSLCQMSKAAYVIFLI